MTLDNTQLEELVYIFQELAELGGNMERTKIFPNLQVVDASPAALPADYIIIQDDEGYYIPALKVPGIVYTNGDLVNVLFIKGTEPIAFQQGPGSPSSPTASVVVRKNGGANVGTRPRLNFIEGTNITLTIADDAGGNELDITVDSTGGSPWKLIALDGSPDPAFSADDFGQMLASGSMRTTDELITDLTIDLGETCIHPSLIIGTGVTVTVSGRLIIL